MTPAPTPTELAEVLEKIITKITRLLERKGIIVKEEPSFQLEISDDDSFAKLQAGAVNYRFAMGPNKGKKALTLRTVTEQDHNATRGLVAKNSGFSLHAGVHVAGSDRQKLEKLCMGTPSQRDPTDYRKTRHRIRAPLTQCQRSSGLLLKKALRRRDHPYRHDTTRINGKNCGHHSPAPGPFN